MFRDGSRVTAQRVRELPGAKRDDGDKKDRGGREWMVEKFRLTSWKCLKRRTPTSVGTARALSVSHSKFSFPTSVSTVPLLSHPPPALPAPGGEGAARPLAQSIASPSIHPFPAISRESSSSSELRRRCSHDERALSLRAFPEGMDHARARAQLATLATMARRMDSRPVRANLADQTGAKSRAFVRVNSIHELSILRTSPSLPSASAGRGRLIAGFPAIPSDSPTFYGAASSRAIHDRSNR